MSWVGVRGRQQEAIFFFRLKLIYRRVKACPADRNFGRGRSAAGLHASPDSLYRTARDERQHRSGVTAIPLRLLPRRCPLCGNHTIIGHGRRRKQAHDREYLFPSPKPTAAKPYMTNLRKAWAATLKKAGSIFCPARTSAHFCHSAQRRRCRRPHGDADAATKRRGDLQAIQSG
jgi:hypothetical protein